VIAALTARFGAWPRGWSWIRARRRPSRRPHSARSWWSTGPTSRRRASSWATRGSRAPTRTGSPSRSST
jgi:hypothetical protein